MLGVAQLKKSCYTSRVPHSTDPESLSLKQQIEKAKDETTLDLLRAIGTAIKEKLQDPNAYKSYSLEKLAKEYRSLLLALKAPSAQTMVLNQPPLLERDPLKEAKLVKRIDDDPKVIERMRETAERSLKYEQKG